MKTLAQSVLEAGMNPVLPPKGFDRTYIYDFIPGNPEYYTAMHKGIKVLTHKTAIKKAVRYFGLHGRVNGVEYPQSMGTSRGMDPEYSYG